MRDEDYVIYKQAVKLAESGQTQGAYEWFKRLRDNGNQDIPLLFWLAKTTPYPAEAEAVLKVIESREPHHPSLAPARNEHARKVQQMQQVYSGPVITCPYCKAQSQTLMKSKLNMVGGIFMGLLLASGVVSFAIGFSSTGYGNLMGFGVFLALLSLIGLFFRERYRVCGYCSARIGG